MYSEIVPRPQYRAEITIAYRQWALNTYVCVWICKKYVGKRSAQFSVVIRNRFCGLAFKKLISMLTLSYVLHATATKFEHNWMCTCDLFSCVGIWPKHIGIFTAIVKQLFNFNVWRLRRYENVSFMCYCNCRRLYHRNNFAVNLWCQIRLRFTKRVLLSKLFDSHLDGDISTRNEARIWDFAHCNVNERNINNKSIQTDEQMSFFNVLTLRWDQSRIDLIFRLKIETCFACLQEIIYHTHYIDWELPTSMMKCLEMFVFFCR